MQTATTEDGRKVILNGNGTWKYAPNVPSTGAASLSVEAGLIYKSGDVKPAARVKLYLLDDDLGSILHAANIPLPKSFGASEKSPQQQMIYVYAFAVKFRDLPEFAAFYDKAAKEIEKHAIASNSTDFSGKAAFESLPPKTYYLMGGSQAGQSVVVWNLKIELKNGKNSVTLDNNNTAFAI